MLIHTNLELWAQKQPHKISIHQGPIRLTYKQLGEKMDCIAFYLSSAAGKGQKIIIKHPNPISQLGFLLGASKAGLVSVLVDITVPNEYYTNLINAIQPALIIDENYSIPSIKTSSLPNVAPDDLFLGALSSGSTGSPKLIWRDHQSWVCAFRHQSSTFKLDKSDILYLVGPLTYTANLNSCLHLLHEGGTVVLADNKHPRNWAKEILEKEITGIFMVPANYRLLLKTLTTPMTQVKSLTSAGSKLDKETLNKIICFFPKAYICEYYGASELGHVSYATASDLLKCPESVGKAFPEVKIRIESQVIWVESPYIAPAYRPQATIGDLGTLGEEGYLYLQGRINQVINCGGVKIIPEQVEAVINRCPGVTTSVVKGIRDVLRGEKAAAWVVRSNPGLTAKTVKTFCQQHLPKNYCPQKVSFIKELPLNINGKVDRSKL